MSLPRRLALSLAVIWGLAVPAAHAQQQQQTLTIGISQFPSNFNPLIESMVAKAYIQGMTMRPFTTYDTGWQLICMLCTTLPSIENGLAKPEDLEGGKKGVAVTYTIQPRARWGDGTPVTTRDVLFTWEVGRHPQTGVSNGEMFRRIRAIDVKDDKTFTLHLDRLTFDYAAINDFQLLPAHLEADAFTRPAEYRTRSRYESDTTNPGLYFGPYRVTEVARGQHVVLERNPNWWGKPGPFQRIVVKAIEASPALEANLLSGGIDMIAGEIGMTLDQALAFEKRKRPEWRIVYKPGLTYEHISVNLDNEILADKRVRQALLYGLDRETMVRQIFEGRQPVAHSMVNPLDKGYDPATRTYPYDPAKAAQLLDEVGWKVGPGGIRRNAKGEKLAIELLTTAGLRNREMMQLVVQQAWRKLGAEVSLRNQPPRIFFSESVLKHAFPSMALFAWMSAPESVPRTIFHSQMVPTAANNFSGQNGTGFRNAEMDALIDATEIELDPAKRQVLWSRIQALYVEELPDLPLTFRSEAHILPVWLDGVEPTGHQYPTTLWIETWRVRQH